MKPTCRSITPRLLRWRRAVACLLMPALLGLAPGTEAAGAPRDRLTLLVPDGTNLSTWQVKVWADSAADEGIRLDVITDSQLLSKGSGAAAAYGGLIVPDSAHIKASDAVVAAIKQYANNGGKLMLVYDAGVLTDTGFYPQVGNSRFADLVGVDYVFWNNGLGGSTMVGFGQVVGTQARLDSLSLPPGKYMPYLPPVSLAMATTSTAFVPTSTADPGGTALMADTVSKRATQRIDDGSGNIRSKRAVGLRELLGLDSEDLGPLKFGRRNVSASKAVASHITDVVSRPPETLAARLGANNAAAIEVGAAALAATDSTLQAISGYGFGPLGYFHYVTTGTFPGTVYLSSPEHGLVAGKRSVGSGQLLFVNMPLGYFRAIGTDAAPMQGFLSHFAREMVGVSTMSVQPRAVGGLIYNWHVDDGDDLKSDAKYLLDNTNIFKRGPYSIQFTAGPDVVTFGDKRGMNLASDKTSQDLVARLGNIAPKHTNGLPVKHALGSHGGWIHDYWGAIAKEANVPDLTSLLTQNFSAIEAVSIYRLREYSSPQGNTPTWAIRWLEARGVVAMYLVGDSGAGIVRSWRKTLDSSPTAPVGARLTSKLWTTPVTPFGRYATWEEFDENLIPESAAGQWLLDLQSFVVNHRTNRLFYNHPPGARAHVNPINALLARADTLKSQAAFNFYSMAGLADFSQRRVETTWSSTTSASGLATFTASHASSLADQTWLLPRARYGQPALVGGNATIKSDSLYWIVSADSGTTLSFRAQEL